MVDRARDRLVLTATMMQRLHDKLRFGLLRPEQADEAAALILAQIGEALALVEEASSSLRRASGKESQAIDPPAVAPAEATPQRATAACAR